MPLNLRAIGAGVIVSIVLGVLTGLTIPFTDIGIPAVSSMIVGIIAGAVAGYLTGPELVRGAIHGGIATALGSIIGVILISLLAGALTGLLGLGVFVVGTILVLAQMIPGAIGGVIGSAISKRLSLYGEEVTDRTRLQ